MVEHRARAPADRWISPYVAEDNDASLRVYTGLLEAMRACEASAAPYLNLVAVFFHDLMMIVTGVTLRARELRGPHPPLPTQLAHRFTHFPYADYADLDGGLDPDAKRYEPQYFFVPWKRKLVSAASGISGLGRPRVALGKPSSLDLNRLVPALLRRRLQLDFPEPAPMAIPGLHGQLDILLSHVEGILDRLGLERMASGFRQVVRRHILARVREGDPTPAHWDILIVGSITDPFNRLLAARSRAAGKPVVELTHGEGDGMLDEPVFGYGERTFATHVVGYGPAGRTLPKSATYATGLYDLPEYVESDSSVVRALYRPDAGVEATPPLDGARAVYVPTSFSGPNRYGPFRDMPDALYLAWQEALFREIPDAVWKGHPKERNHALIPSTAAHTSRRPLGEYLVDADVFIFDYLSTALVTVMATSKPVVFFDVGLRNLSAEALTLLKERCTYVSVDPTRPDDLRDRTAAAAAADGERTNRFTPEHALASGAGGGSREQTLVDTIARVLS
jgi:hypothetical protein